MESAILIAIGAVGFLFGGFTGAATAILLAVGIVIALAIYVNFRDEINAVIICFIVGMFAYFLFLSIF